MTEWRSIMDRAEQRLASSRDDLDAGRHDVGYESARAAAELAGKALLLSKTGTYPTTKDHNVTGPLHQKKLIPTGISAKELSALLGDYARGDYGFKSPVEPREHRAALEIAEAMLAAADQRGPPR